MNSIGINELRYMLQGLSMTLRLWVVSFFFGMIMGIILGIAKSNHKIKVFRWIAAAYIDMIRGIPLIVFILVGYFGANYLGSDIDLPRFGVASAVLSLYSAAYLGEIFRSGIESVHKNQWEAASALGFSYVQSLRYVIIPQAIRITIPSTIGFLIGLLKGTSMVIVISLTDLTTASRRIAEHTRMPFLVLGLAAMVYFVLNYPLTKLGEKLEEKYKIKKGSLT